MRKIQNLVQKIIVKNKGKGRDNLIMASLLFLSVCISTLIFIGRNEIKNIGGYGYVGIFLLSILGSSTIVVSAPTFLSTLIGGSVLNPYFVGLVSGLGSSIGELTGYLAGYGGKVLAIDSKIYKKISGWMQRRGFLTVFLLAAIPNPLFDLAGIFAGLTNYSVKKFLLATFLGKTIKFTLIALLGLAAGNIFPS